MGQLDIDQDAATVRADDRVDCRGRIDVESGLEILGWRSEPPSWWSKPVKELKLAKFNARAEPSPRSRYSAKLSNVIVALIPISGYYQWQDTPGAKQPW